jgi:hypothetical protein
MPTPLSEMQASGKGSKYAIRTGVMEGYDVPATADDTLHPQDGLPRTRGYRCLVCFVDLMACGGLQQIDIFCANKETLSSVGNKRC